MIRFIHGLLKIFVLLLVSTPSFSQDHHVLSLVSPHFPPYTFEKNNEVIGIGPALIKQVLDNTNIPYKITMVEDYGEAVHVIQENLADGMFLASQNAERDSIAVFTQPLLINKWSWFVLKDSEVNLKSEAFKLASGIGTIKGTNTYRWLKRKGFTIIALPTESSSLVAMLKSKRIDAVFVADAVFENELNAQELSQFKKVVEVEKPFAMYISHDYLEKYPNSLEQINLSIKELLH